MTRLRLAATVAGIVLVLVSAAPAFAWNARGHMLVAALAYERLTPTVRARADALLKLNPSYPRWVAQLPADLPPADRPEAIFMIASTWADQIKSDPAYHDDGTANGDQPGGPDSSLNVGYSDRLRHKYWHYIDEPFSTDGAPLPPVPTPNAVDRIRLFRDTLASTASDALKSYDLTWLLHIVGDLHQPLHSVTRVGQTQPTGDAGGNFVALCEAPCRSELHGLWDGSMGANRSPTEVMQAAAALPAADAARARDLDPAHWAAEGLALSRSDVYTGPIGEGRGPFIATPSYETNVHAVATTRIVLAGARLAALLNANLK